MPTEPEDNKEADLLRRSKVSPYLWAMFAAWDHTGRKETPEGARVANAGDTPVVPITIELKDPDTTELTRAGISFKHAFGLFYTAEIPLDRLDSLVDLESILRVHHEPSTKPTLDDSIPEIRCSSVRNPQFPFSGTN